MAVNTGSVNGIAQGTGRDTFWNNFPRGERYVNLSGPSSNNLTIQELKKYEIDIDSNIRVKQAMKFPFKHIIENLSSGAGTITTTDITWTDRYMSGDGVMTIPFDDLRCRDYDQADTFVQSTMGIGAYAERGGKMMWQRCSFGSSTTVTTGDMTALNTAYVTPTSAGCYHIGSKNPIVGTSSLISGIDGELKETAPFPMTYDSINYNCLAYGFSRSSDYIVGKTDGILHMLAAILENRSYQKTTSTSIYWKDEAGATTPASTPTISYAFKKGQSKKVHMYWDQLYTAGTVGETVTYSNKMQVIFGIQQIIFTNDLTKFIIIFDMDSNNIDVNNSLTKYDASTTAVPGDIWAMCTKGTFTVNTNKTILVGDIFRTDIAGLTASAANQCVSVPFAILVEEVNTSTDKTGAFIHRGVAADGSNEAPIFSNASASSATQGWSRMASRVLLNLHQDVPTAVGSAQEFDLTSLKGGYFYDEFRTKTNNLQIFQSKPWGAEKLRMNTSIAFGDPMNLDRMMHIAEFDKDVNNAILFGRKRRTQTTSASTNQSYQISNPAGSYQGTMAGVFSYEDFPLVYVKKPFTLSNTASLLAGGSDAAYGYAFYNFMEEFCDAVSFTAQPGQYTGTSCFMSRTVMQTLRMNQYRTQSAISANGNILGHVVYNPKSEANMFIDNYEYTSSRGITLRFIYDPSLDFALPFPAPRFLLGRTGRKSEINPRWCIIAIDKNHIRTYQHAAFPDKIYGNLQPNNNVNISIEGMQGSRTLELRFPEAHLIMDISNT